MELFTLEAKLTLDTSDYEQKIDDVIAQAKLDGAVLADTLYAETEKKSGTGMTGVSPAAKPGSGAGETAKGILWSKLIQKGADIAFDAGKEAVNTASNLKEMQNVIDKTFGASAETINQWAQGQAQLYGLSELQAKRFAAEYGAYFMGQGTDAEIAQRAIALAERTGDLASFRNIDLEMAKTAISSGIRGETEPLSKYDLAPYAASVGEYLGLDFLSLSEDEKKEARYNYILGKSQYFAGDFADTQNEFANAGRTLENHLETLSAKFGEKLLPLMTGATNAANSFFEALYSKSAEESLASINQTAESAAQSIGSTAEQARAMVGVLEDYGNRSALTAQQQEQWDYVANSLVRTIPELSSLLNTQTGQIAGGTSALYENISAWEEAGKVAADTSALEAKKDFLSDLSQSITREQAEIAIAEKELSTAQTALIAKAEEAAAATGEAFDGTEQSALYMLNRWGDYYKSYGVKEIESTTSAYEDANAAVTTHKENLASLQEDYATVEQSIETESLALSTAVGTMEKDVTSSFENVGSSMDTLVSDMDQSDTAYTNAYNTGIGAAIGLNDAYPAWEAAMSKYRYIPSGMDTAETYGPIQTEDTIWGSVGSAVSNALNGAAVIMDGRRVGDLVTETVSRNIAQSSRGKRYAT